MSAEFSDLPPRASAVLHSLRAVGYDLPTAIADIVDNSLAARARSIAVSMHFDGADTFVRIEDDGVGMDAVALDAAMRLGSQHPSTERDAADHGRFGLGLKTASFGQCRRLTVRSRLREGEEETRSWDLDHVEGHDAWALRRGSWDARSELRVGHIVGAASGTIVLWEKLDRVVEAPGRTAAHEDFDRKIDETIDHLAMVFHRLIDAAVSPVTIRVNGRRVEGWDPLLSRHPRTRQLHSTKLSVNGVSIVVASYIIPPESRLSSDDARRAAGPRGWLAHQGIYLYRNRRLLVTGGWLGLARRDPQYSLARIRVDVDNRLDDVLRIDIRKARARVPDQIREPMRIIAEKTREEAASAWRASSALRAPPRPPGPAVPIWRIESPGSRPRLRVNAEHPVVHAIRARLGDDAGMLDSLLGVVASTVPVDLLLQMAGTAPAGASTLDPTISPDVRALTREVVALMRKQGLADSTVQERLASTEPWADMPPGVLQSLVGEA